MKGRQTKQSPETMRAIIYCRVSSVAQLKKGDGLSSQESRCREYAGFRGYQVETVFSDHAVSGGDLDRPGLKALLAYLKANAKGEPIIVVIDDINRLSRDVVVHWQLRALLAEAGGKLESPSIEFGDDSDSILVENLLASVSQHQRQKNSEQTKNRMRGRAMNGYWPFRAAPGFKYERISGHGNLLVRDEPLASIIQEALEGFATGRFGSQAEVKRYLESQPAFPKDLPNGTIRFESVARLMSRVIYAGYIDIPEWNVSLRKGQHTGLVSFEHWQRIQAKIEEGARAPIRKDISEDFPLRGFVNCGCCDKPLTGNWSRSKTGKLHAYYLCFNKACEMRGKSIPRARIEGEFVELLQDITPAQPVMALAKNLFKHGWSIRSQQTAQALQTIDDQIADQERQCTKLIERIVATDSERLISSYEAKLAEMEKHKLVLVEQRQKRAQKPRPFSDMFELACTFLSNP